MVTNQSKAIYFIDKYQFRTKYVKVKQTKKKIKKEKRKCMQAFVIPGKKTVAESFNYTYSYVLVDHRGCFFF